MASHIIVAAAIAVILAVCLIQVNSAPQEASTTPSSLQTLIEGAQDHFNQAYEGAKPKLDELVSKGQALLASAIEEAGKFNPTAEKKPAA